MQHEIREYVYMIPNWDTPVYLSLRNINRWRQRSLTQGGPSPSAGQRIREQRFLPSAQASLSFPGHCTLNPQSTYQIFAARLMVNPPALYELSGPEEGWLSSSTLYIPWGQTGPLVLAEGASQRGQRVMVKVRFFLHVPKPSPPFISLYFSSFFRPVAWLLGSGCTRQRGL